MKPLNDYFEFNIAGEFLSPLVNGDYSGLKEHEIKLFDAWLSSVSDYGSTFDIADNDYSFLECDVCGLYAECYTVRQYFHNPEVTA